MELLQPSRKLPETIADQIRRYIINEQLTEGDRLPTEGELVERFGVSRSTIREAVKLLLAERVVEIRRGQGTFVANNPGLSKDPLGLRFADQSSLLQNLMEARMLLEPNVAYLAAQRRTDVDLRTLRGLIEQMDAAFDRKEDYTPFDIRFHSAVAASTHNDVLQRLLPVINESITEGYHQTVHVQGSYPKASKYHSLIFMAIAASNADEAKRAAELHIQQTLEDSNVKTGGNHS